VRHHLPVGLRGASPELEPLFEEAAAEAVRRINGASLIVLFSIPT
jgi:hypothetical protein